MWNQSEFIPNDDVYLSQFFELFRPPASLDDGSFVYLQWQTQFRRVSDGYQHGQGVIINTVLT